MFCQLYGYLVFDGYQNKFKGGIRSMKVELERCFDGYKYLVCRCEEFLYSGY